MASYQKLFSLISRYLQPGEAIIESAYATAVDIPHSAIMVATENRVIVLVKKFLSHDVDSFPFDKINSIEESAGVFGYSIQVNTSGNSVKLNIIAGLDGNSDKLLEYVNSKIGKKSEPAAGESIIEKIKQLDELKKAGIISEEEFNDKKRELLSKL